MKTLPGKKQEYECYPKYQFGNCFKTTDSESKCPKSNFIDF